MKTNKRTLLSAFMIFLIMMPISGCFDDSWGALDWFLLQRFLDIFDTPGNPDPPPDGSETLTQAQYSSLAERIESEMLADLNDATLWALNGYGCGTPCACSENMIISSGKLQSPGKTVYYMIAYDRELKIHDSSFLFTYYDNYIVDGFTLNGVSNLETEAFTEESCCCSYMPACADSSDETLQVSFVNRTYFDGDVDVSIDNGAAPVLWDFSRTDRYCRESACSEPVWMTRCVRGIFGTFSIEDLINEGAECIFL